MTSEIRTNSLKSRAGLSTVTFTDSGPMFSGITTFVDNSGFNIGTGSSIFSPATNTLTFGTNSNERLRIDSSGNIGAGIAPSSGARLWIATNDNPFIGTRYNAGADGSVLFLQHSRSNTIGTNVSLNDNDEVGTIQFRAYASNNSSVKVAASIKAEVNGTTGTGGVPTDLIFATGTNSSNATDRLRIDSSGRVLIGTSTSAYKFCVADNTNASLVSQLVNTNTGSSTKSIFQIQTGSNRYVNFENDYTGQYIHVVGSGITTYFSSFDTHRFRNNAGTERLTIASDGKITHSSSFTETIDFGSTSANGAFHKYDLSANGATTGYIGAGNQLVVNANVADFAFRSQANMVFSSGGDVERLRIKSDGKVGIGTNNPSVLTHIYDSTNTSTATEQLRISGGNRTADNIETGFRFFTQSPSVNGNRHIRFTSNGNTGLIIQPYETSTGNAAVDRTIDLCPSGGRVEIGANGSAYGRLSVSSLDGVQSGGSAIQVMNTAAGSGDGSTTNLILRSVNSAGTQWAMAEYRAQYHKFSNQGTEVLRTQASGDYGSVETRSTKGGYGGYGIVAGGANHVFMGDGGGAGLYNDTNNGWYIYGTKGGDTFLYSNGSPTFRSYVTGDYGCVQTTGTKNGWGGLSISGQYNFMSDGGACGIYNDIDNEWMAYFARNGAFILYNNGEGVLTSDTNGPIVTTHNHLKLNQGNWTGEHAGKMQFHSGYMYNQSSTGWIFRDDGTNGNYDVYTINQTGGVTTSDERLKENIKTIPDALNKVNQLKGRSFDFKSSGIKSQGVIAQEVEPILPDIVTTTPVINGEESYKKVNYGALSGVFIEAIKELKAKIETLEGESLKLKEENAALRVRVTNLEGE